MPAHFQYRPRFVDIRVRPPADDGSDEDVTALKPGERACEHPECRRPGATRAPKSRDMLGDHYWFCQAHAAEYNRSWNFFAGLTEDEVRERVIEDVTTGGRPTWPFKASAQSREATGARGGFTDPFGLFGGDPAKARAAAARERGLGRLERQALADLDLEPGVQGPAIRARYAELVKRCHPDANGGDRSAEHKLQRVIRAYKTLRKAKLA